MLAKIPITYQCDKMRGHGLDNCASPSRTKWEKPYSIILSTHRRAALASAHWGSQRLDVIDHKDRIPPT
jgi:hypothetical protein